MTFEGEHYRTEAAEIIPRGPRPDGIPVMVAGIGEKTLAVGARFGDQVNVNRALVTADDAASVIALVNAAAEAVDRDPATLGISGWVRLSVDDDGIAQPKTGCIPGSPAEVAETVAAIHAAGLEHLTFYIGAADDPSPLPALTDDTLERFAPFLEAIRASV